jgi:hypothetical protein
MKVSQSGKFQLQKPSSAMMKLAPMMTGTENCAAEDKLI